MTKIELFEEALCCSTGVCGPSVDENLLQDYRRFEAMNKAEGMEAKRYLLSSTPQQFILNPQIGKLLTELGMDALPVTIVNGQVKKTGAYPTHAELTDYTGFEFKEADPTVSVKG